MNKMLWIKPVPLGHTYASRFQLMRIGPAEMSSVQWVGESFFRNDWNDSVRPVLWTGSLYHKDPTQNTDSLRKHTELHMVHLEFNQVVPLRSHCAHTSTPRRRSCQWCHPVLTAGGAAVTGSSSLRANRERAKRTPAACVHGLWEDLTAALRSSTASQTLEQHTLRQAKTKPSALKLQLDKKVRVYFESIEGYY